MEIIHNVKVDFCYLSNITYRLWIIDEFLSLQEVFKVCSLHSHSTPSQKLEIFLDPTVQTLELT
jgi:hypothetical protein